ncbi:unnamed protein product, partial [Arabidopsis halleri]
MILPPTCFHRWRELPKNDGLIYDFGMGFLCIGPSFLQIQQ